MFTIILVENLFDTDSIKCESVKTASYVRRADPVQFGQWGKSRGVGGKGTGKSISEALTLASSNPEYDKGLLIELLVQYMKTTSSEHVVYIICFLF